MAMFKSLPDSEKNKIHFIHFNHTNPALNIQSKQTKQILANGFNIARMMDIFPL
jgi:pyrroloquinoline quinone biosynthesis protein B